MPAFPRTLLAVLLLACGATTTLPSNSENSVVRVVNNTGVAPCTTGQTVRVRLRTWSPDDEFTEVYVTLARQSSQDVVMTLYHNQVFHADVYTDADPPTVLGFRSTTIELPRSQTAQGARQLVVCRFPQAPEFVNW